MVRNRNGYWMSPKFFMNAPDNGGGTGGDAGSAGAGDGASGGDSTGGAGASSENTDKAWNGGNSGQWKDDKDDQSADQNAEIERLKAEIAKQKATIDKVTKEAGDARKALKAKMTQEEIDAEAKKAEQEKKEQELEELRRTVAKGETVRSVMGKLGLDEGSAGNLADHLYGAADIDNALLEIQKAWQAKEAALRKEFGKVTAPGAGADSNSPEAQAIERAKQFGRQQSAVSEQAQKALGAYLR